jgi:hypothetical protein
MAEWHAGVRQERPAYQPVLGHPWEKAWVSEKPIDWNLEPAFSKLQWLPSASESSPPPPPAPSAPPR